MLVPVVVVVVVGGGDMDEVQKLGSRGSLSLAYCLLFGTRKLESRMRKKETCAILGLWQLVPFAVSFSLLFQV